MTRPYKILFISSMVLGTLVTASSSSWMGMWMGLEINLLSIIPLMIDKKNPLSTEASLKYLLTQALASIILLLTMIVILSETEIFNPLIKESSSMFLNSALFTKLGAAPFHFWFPEIMEGLSWFNCAILMTWQKIAPFTILIVNYPHRLLLIVVILLSIVVGGLQGINQTSLRKIMAYSSISHIGWMTAATLTNNSFWTIYWFIYSFLTINLSFILSQSKSSVINQMINSLSLNKTTKLAFMINFFSLGGLPPFLGFLPKWLVVNSLCNSNEIILPIFMVLMTLLSLFMYARLIFPSLALNYSIMKLNPTFKINSYFLFINIISNLAIIVSPLTMNSF